MFIPKEPKPKTGLEETIDELIVEMKQTHGDSPEYTAMADNLVKIYKLKAEDKPQRVNPDTIALITGNLLGIVMIVQHERMHVIGSKAIGFVKALR